MKNDTWYRCNICGREGRVGRCCSDEDRTPLNGLAKAEQERIKGAKNTDKTPSEGKPAPVGQTRRRSLLESLVNILVGYFINFTANLLIFPIFGWHISTRENLTLGVIYTGISLVRSYGLRRFFNRNECKK